MRITKEHSMALSIVTLMFLTLISSNGWSVKADNSTIDSTSMVILSPQSTVYHSGTIDVTVVVNKPTDQQYPLITRIQYTFNESDIFSYKYANFTFRGIVNLANNKTAYQYTGNATIDGLKEGNYTLHVAYGQGNNTIGSFSGSSVNFRVVYGNYEPAALLSPTNQTYHSSNVPLSISVNEDYVYAYYCLNGGKPIFLNKTSSTLNGFPLGSNNLVVFVKFKDIYSDFSVNFTVDSNQIDDKQNTGYEWIFLGAIGIAITLTVIAFLSRRKRIRDKQTTSSLDST